MNGLLLNFGSSAIAMFCASTLPENKASFKLPTFTWRPNAVVSSDSNLGRKLLASMKNGMATATTMRTARTMPAILRIFTAYLLLQTEVESELSRGKRAFYGFEES